MQDSSIYKQLCFEFVKAAPSATLGPVDLEGLDNLEWLQSLIPSTLEAITSPIRRDCLLAFATQPNSIFGLMPLDEVYSQEDLRIIIERFNNPANHFPYPPIILDANWPNNEWQLYVALDNRLGECPGKLLQENNGIIHFQNPTLRIYQNDDDNKGFTTDAGRIAYHKNIHLLGSILSADFSQETVAFIDQLIKGAPLRITPGKILKLSKDLNGKNQIEIIRTAIIKVIGENQELSNACLLFLMPERRALNRE